MNFRFRSHEKLKDDLLISYVFENGKKFHHYPLLFLSVNLPVQKDLAGAKIASQRFPDVPLKIAFTVPKRKFRKAVHRNRIKRLMREAYRLQKHNYISRHSEKSPSTKGVVVIFIGKEIPEYSVIFKAMNRFIDQL